MPAPLCSPGVDELELLAARTWRGLEEETYGDWLLRAADGFTGRANSALVVGEPPAAGAAAVADVARWYTARGLRPRAQVPSSPGGEVADAAFAAAGWERDEDVLVLTAPLAGWPTAAVPVELAPEPDDAWLTGYRYRGAPLPAVARRVLLAADDPVFATVRAAHPPAAAAVGRGAVVDGWLVVTALTVAEEHRRRGLAGAVMGALGAWAAGRGAHSCVLQVVAGNAPALALYDRLGFRTHHRYHYRLAAG